MNILNWFKNDYELIEILELGGDFKHERCYGKIYYSKNKNKYIFKLSSIGYTNKIWYEGIYIRMEVMCENRIIELKQNK